MRLYRYLEKQHVEIFFDTGSLMLSSFERCRRHEGARGDTREGKASFFIGTRSQAISGIFSAGENTYTLSTSRIFSEELMHKFNVDDYFIIKRPGHFLHAISEYLQDIDSTHLGNCIYSDNGFETTYPRSPEQIPSNFGELSERERIRWFEGQNEQLQAIMQNSLGNKGLFTKRYADYHDEEEYRFAWVINQPVKELLLINCKEATRYCRYR